MLSIQSKVTHSVSDTRHYPGPEIPGLMYIYVCNSIQTNKLEYSHTIELGSLKLILS